MGQPKKAVRTEILDVTPETFQEIREFLKAVNQISRVVTHSTEGELLDMTNIALRCVDLAKDQVKVYLVYKGKVVKK